MAVDRAAAMVEEMLRQGQCSPSISTASNPALVNGVKVQAFIIASSCMARQLVVLTNGTFLLSLVNQVLSTCVLLGFDADPSMNIVARIRGPNVSAFLIC